MVTGPRSRLKYYKFTEYLSLANCDCWDRVASVLNFIKICILLFDSHVVTKIIRCTLMMMHNARLDKHELNGEQYLQKCKKLILAHNRLSSFIHGTILSYKSTSHLYFFNH